MQQSNSAVESRPYKPFVEGSIPSFAIASRGIGLQTDTAGKVSPFFAANSFPRHLNLLKKRAVRLLVQGSR